jgi:predicted DsbA family dithiol-disulfide isomerase
MNTPIRPITDVRRTLDIDLVADFTCPWSWLGMAQLTRALGNLSGEVETRLRWHPFRMAPPNANTAPRSFHDYLAERLPQGISVPFAEKSLEEAGRELGIEFHFEKLGALPSTAEAHRLVQLAADAGKHANVAAGVFRAYFENGADIADIAVLEKIGAEAGLDEKTLKAFRETREGDNLLVGSEERLRGFGVRTVPNLLFGGRVLVPGTVNVATYVHALDQALFPSTEELAGEGEGERKQKPTLH